MGEQQNEKLALDELLDLQISKDGLSASIRLKPETSHYDISEEELLNFLSSKKVQVGLVERAIKDFIDNPQLFKEEELIIAIGKEAINGEDSYLEMIYQKNNKSHPTENEDGSVDFFSITEISNVEKGQLLAKNMPPTSGENGLTVTNQVIKAKEGRNLKAKLGKNVVIDHGTQAVYAMVSGQVSFTEGDKINVFPIYEVPGDLDLSIGNIDFVGNVIIKGNVPTGFKVKAKGDIRIGGGVEGGELDAEGSIEIMSGITAQHKGYVRAGQDIKTNFINNGNVTAGGSVIVSQSIMHSTVNAGVGIECMGQKGLIVGGSFQVGKSLKCRTIGNMMSTPTTVEIGMNPKSANRLKEVHHLLKEHTLTVQKTDQALVVLGQLMTKLGHLSPDKKELQLKLTNTKLEMEKEIKQLLLESKEIEEELQEVASSTIEVTGIAHPGTKLVFGKYIKYIKDNEKSVKYSLVHNEIVSKPLL
jgi:uncharacterized protein (DUF342 family)